MTERVLVTGATGFVGSELCRLLVQSGYRVRAALRTPRPVPASIAEQIVVGEIDDVTEWQSALRDVQYVVHLAARVHVMHDSAANTDLYVRTNVRGTARLALQAADAGVRRLIYLSSIKVNGEQSTAPGFSAAQTPQPADAYGVSKWNAEQCLQELTGRLEVAIVRPPLVYGPGVRANFLRLMRWVDQERPLPLASIDNQRSLVSVWNLCDLIQLLLHERRAAGKTWMVADDESLATPELIRRLARAMQRRVRLLRVPTGALRVLGHLTGKSEEVARLCSSLVVDTEVTRRELGWSPPVSVDDSLARTVRWYLQEGTRGY
ncbi:MAG TPA: NAD-dependent epimerase/dehydratase family protein [Steroidobacteraceae bacterium]|nr:NAD-dependent epimerase/dehydratase family protein [Steroidobacteraceae bacterium]